MQGQPPPEGGEDDKEKEQTDDKKQKENTAYAKKMVLRLAGLMGVGGAVSMVYVFGEFLLTSMAPGLCFLFAGVVGDKKPVRLESCVFPDDHD